MEKAAAGHKKTPRLQYDRTKIGVGNYYMHDSQYCEVKLLYKSAPVIIGFKISLLLLTLLALAYAKAAIKSEWRSMFEIQV